MPSSDADRLADLERAVFELRRDVQDLRAALAARPPGAPAAGRAPAPGRAAPPPTARPPLLARVQAYARIQAAGLGVPGADAAAPGPDAPAPDLEAVVGRYGTVAVAALLILMAVGAFLTWAIATFTISPPARVGVGALGAVTLAAVGLWLRRRGATAAARAAAPGASAASEVAAEAAETDSGEGTQRFGDVLLALALAVTHVVAWAAGPLLGLVPPAASLGIAAAASAALAGLAWRARQQTLFLVGVGGALLAPFVTSGITGNAVSLRVYGWLVLSSALLAVPTALELVLRWRAAVRLLGVGGALYTVAHLRDALAVATVGDPAGLGTWTWTLRRDLPALFALACAAVPIARAAVWHRAGAHRAAGSSAVPVAFHAQLALAYLAAAAGALVALGINTSGGAPSLVALALLTTVGVYAAVHLLHNSNTIEPETHAWYIVPFVRVTQTGAALVYPLALLGAALLALPEVVGSLGALTAAAWGAVAAVMAWRTAPNAGPDAPHSASLSSAHAAVAGLSTALVPVFLFSGHDVVRVTLLAAHAAVAVQLLRVLRHPLALLAPALVASVAAAWAWVLLAGRPAYAYTPFLTPESAAAGAVVLAWSAIAVRVWRDGTTAFPRGERRLMVAAASGVALLWGRQELARAVAPDVSTFLLIGYFAAAGIAAIALGRARKAPAARQVGLALALYAALKALVQASELDAVGLRVASYLVVGGFLLGVGYWYRAAGSRRAASPVSNA